MLILMPAAVLVVLVLAAISVDLAVVHLRQRAGIDAATSAANDAVTAGLDQSALRSGDGYRLDPARVEAAVSRSLEDQGIADTLVGEPAITMPSPTTVVVVLHLRAETVFAGAVLGGSHPLIVSATGRATAVHA